MNKIDTEYTSLSEIDPEITPFYSEDVRTRTVGYTEVEEGETPEPITEEYTVIVLNQPDEVSYEYAESRRGRRLGEEVTKAALAQAIEWEEFKVNHDDYLLWLDAYSTWETEQPTETVEEEEVVVAAPIRPVVDLANRRAVYEKLKQPYDTVLFHHEVTTVEFDDVTYTATSIPLLIDNDPKDIAETYRADAKVTRDNLYEANIVIDEMEFQVHKANDMPNVDEAIFEAREEGLANTTTTPWTLTDNSVVLVTLEQLTRLKRTKIARKQEIHTAYETWRAGDMQTPFIYE